MAVLDGSAEEAPAAVADLAAVVGVGAALAVDADGALDHAGGEPVADGGGGRGGVAREAAAATVRPAAAEGGGGGRGLALPPGFCLEIRLYS